MFLEERRVSVDEALAKLEERQAQEHEDLRNQHEKELRDLEQQHLSPEELEQRRAQLLNQQQLKQSALDKKHAEERKQIQHGTLAEWEVRFARAKLELKEKHYQVRVYSPSLPSLPPSLPPSLLRLFTYEVEVQVGLVRAEFLSAGQRPLGV